MRIVMFMEWDGVTPAQYDAARDVVKWETDAAPGGVLHVATFTDKGLRVTDVWESAEDFQRFVQTRLMPGVRQVGIPGEPKVEVYPLHALFTPAFTAVGVG